MNGAGSPQHGWSPTALRLLTALLLGVGAPGCPSRSADGAAAASAPPPAAVSWQAPTVVATGAARVGPWRMNESDWDYVDDGSPAIAPDGTVAVAWVDQGAKDVFLQVYGPDGAARRPAPVNVSRSPAVFSWLPRVVLGRGAPPVVHVLWQEIVFSGGSHGGEAFYARSTDGGATFGAPVNLSESRAGDGKGRITKEIWHNGSLDLVAGPGAALYAAWTEYDGALWVRASADGGASFAPALRVGGSDERPARGPTLAVGRDGAVHLAWTVGGDDGADLRYARSEDGGRSFGHEQVLHRSPAYDDAPKLAVDRAGALHLAWAERPQGPFGPAVVRHARTPSGAPPFPAEPRRFGPPEGAGLPSADFPQLATDARGDVLLVYELLPAGRGRPQARAFTLSTDGGQTFAPPALVPDPASAPDGGVFHGSLQGLLMRTLAVAPDGGVALVESTFAEGRGSQVRLRRGRLPTGRTTGSDLPP